MTLEVEPADLRAAAKVMDEAAQPLACRHVPTTGVSGENFGHVELADWTTTILEYCAEANSQLSMEASRLAEGLRATATDMETRDQEVGATFCGPLGTQGPGSTPHPSEYGAPGSPLFGPPSGTPAPQPGLPLFGPPSPGAGQ